MIGSNTRPDAKWRRRTLAGLLFLGLDLFGSASKTGQDELPQYARDEWTVSRGYPGGHVYGITQTPDGYLWLGTGSGLVRFDGSVFHGFQQTEPGHQPIDPVLALASDTRGNLLISTQKLHLLRLRNERLEEVAPAPGQPQGVVSSVDQGRDGTILVGTMRQGLAIYDGTTFSTFPRKRSDITAAVRTDDGTLWVGTTGQGLFASPSRSMLTESPLVQALKINALIPLGERGLRIGTDKGLLQWDGDHPPRPPFGPPHIQVMLEDRQGVLWLGSTHGLYRASAKNASQTVSRFSDDIVTSLYEDREGNIWAGTATGLVRLRRRVLTTYSFNADAGGSGGPIAADDQGSVWCIRPSGRLVRITDSRVDILPGGGDAASLAAVGDAVWLGGKDGVLRQGRAAAPLLQLAGKRNLGRPVVSLLQSRDGTLWAGLENAGVVEVAGGRTTLHSAAGGLSLETVRAMEEGPDGTLWFAAASGVASFSRGQWRGYSVRDGLPPGRVNCLFADERGVVWIGADQGLAYIENGKAHIPAPNSPLIDESILGIAADRDDRLWILTSTHVLRVKRPDLIAGGAGSFAVRQFGVDDGLPPLPPSRSSRSIITDARGRVWMVLGHLVVMADPLALRQAPPPTLVQLQQILADDQPLALDDTVNVPSGHLRATIRFAGLNLAAPDRVRFRYRLSGFDRNWSEPTPVREAVYTNLTPGPYRFEVQASTMDGEWTGPSTTVGLDVEPALWQTLWFRSLAAVALCAAVFTLYRLRLRAIQHAWTLRFEERIEERSRIARELHDTLLQSFHGLILRFQAVRDMLPEQPEAASDALGSVIDRAAAAITEGRDAVQALRGEEECDDLGESLATIDQEFRSEAPGSLQAVTGAGYRVLVEGTPRRLHPVVRDDLYRIAREAVRNAFRHAEATAIELDIRYDERLFCLRVRDDGAGIDPHVLDLGRRRGHYGLPGMRERATSIGGQFEIWSEVRRGTEIEVTVPALIAYVPAEPAGPPESF